MLSPHKRLYRSTGSSRFLQSGDPPPGSNGSVSGTGSIARRTHPECIVIGAGPAGLASAWRLQQAGITVEVWEAESWVGGRTRTISHGGSRLNTGAAFFASFYAETLKLAEDIGLPLIRSTIHPGRPGKIREMHSPDGKAAYNPGSFAGFWQFPLVPLRDKLRFLQVLMSFLAGPSTHIADPTSLVPFDCSEMRNYIERSLAGPVYDYFVRPAVEPFFYVGADEVSPALIRCLLRHAIHWKLWTPRDGMSALCEGLASRVPCRLNRRVTAIDRIGNRLRVQFEHGFAEAASVIVAIPPPDIRGIAAPISPVDFSDISQISFAPSVNVFLGYDRAVKLQPVSIVFYGPGQHPLVGVMALSSGGPTGFIAPGKEVVVCLTTGWRSRELLALSPSNIVSAVMDDVAHAGISLPPPDWTLPVARDCATVVTSPGIYSLVTSFMARTRKQIHFAGDWLSACSTVEGAVRSGHQAADHVLRELRNVGDS